MADRYPGIRRATIEIAYDNGAVNSRRGERSLMAKLDRFLEEQPEEILGPIDAWLAGLSDDDLTTACCGEETEMEALMRTGPVFAHGLLNDCFDQVL